MSLPMTAVGPLNVETKPILMVSPAQAGFASTSAAAPASQNAVLITTPFLILNYPGMEQSSLPGTFYRTYRTQNPSCRQWLSGHTCTIIRRHRKWQEV